MKNNFDFATREDALTQLWDKRGEFEKEDKLEEFEQIEKQIKQIPVLNLTITLDRDIYECFLRLEVHIL